MVSFLLSLGVFAVLAFVCAAFVLLFYIAVLMIAESFGY
jgi:hypothetical protein